MKPARPKTLFFATPADFRAWLEKNHALHTELSVGFYKRDSGKPSITWPESVDAALCYGWIDGVRNSIDAVSYRIRFTPRKPTSTWSAINVKRVAELTKLGLMHPAGVKAFEALKGDKTGNLRLRTTQNRKTPPGLRKEIPSQPESLGLLPDTATVVPAHRHLSRDQRKTGSHARETPGRVDSRFGSGAPDQRIAPCEELGHGCQASGVLRGPTANSPSLNAAAVERGRFQRITLSHDQEHRLRNREWGRARLQSCR
jgi:uncharacterized protein YdeI (YjbR/CyaY-like superfamily)